MKKHSASLFVFTILLTACTASPQETVLEETSDVVVNPNTGTEIHIEEYTPDSYFDDALNTLVLVPGAGGDSSNFEEKRQSAQELANEGFIVVTFDPSGRGQSGGEENQYGTIDQDGLKAVIDSLDAQHIGLVTFSYGVTMGSGMLARYPDSPVEFLIDWEGPADRTDTGGCDKARTGHMNKLADCTDETFWAEREALTFISQIKVPYLRMQSQKDHAQPDAAHAIKMVNTAIEGGNTDWVRINDNPVNQIYDEENTPELRADSADKTLMQDIGTYAHELFAN